MFRSGWDSIDQFKLIKIELYLPSLDKGGMYMLVLIRFI